MDGAFYVAWAEEGGVWQEPVGISPIGIAPKGACVATASGAGKTSFRSATAPTLNLP